MGRWGDGTASNLIAVFLSPCRRASYRRALGLIFFEPTPHQCEAHDVNTTVQVELAHGVGAVRLNGLDADVEPGGDLFVAVAPGDQLQDFFFALADPRLVLNLRG